jgi:hypothetical protein
LLNITTAKGNGPSYKDLDDLVIS